MPELADIFRRYGPEYLEQFGERMLPSHRRVIQDIADCRTETLGGHLVQCDFCGYLDYYYHSCRNRNCPKCQLNETQKWVDKRESELLPVTYFHVVFTLPKELHELVRTNQKTLYDLLIKAAAHSLMKLAADPKYVGGKIGLLCVLHTWTRAMVYHPHVHCLVPGGGISPDGHTWLAARNNFLVPVRALSEIFRAKFMELARKALPEETFPKSVWETKWVVYSKPAVQGSQKVLRYLARYVHRIAITNNRILSADDHRVTFRYKDSREGRWKTMTLPALEFMRRFLQHVLPKDFHKVRYYGLLSPVKHPLLKQIRLLLASQTNSYDRYAAQSQDTLDSQKPDHSRCPYCLIGSMVVIAILPVLHPQAPGRSPPL